MRGVGPVGVGVVEGEDSTGGLDEEEEESWSHGGCVGGGEVGAGGSESWWFGPEVAAGEEGSEVAAEAEAAASIIWGFSVMIYSPAAAVRVEIV